MARRYFVTTFGCQMNAHDSERIKGMLEELGLGEAATAADADVVVFNTCTIREKPDTKLAAYLGDAAARKREDPDRVIAVGGCYAEAQRERIFELYPAVDVAFGPARSRTSATGSVRAASASRAVASASTTAASRPSCRCTANAPSRRGCRCRWAATPSAPTASSRPSAAASRAGGPARSSPRSRASPREGVREVTLLGQNVNSWGRDLLPEIRTEFGELLRACDAVDGIERIRFTSPHPKDFRDPVIAAIAECDAVCEHVHLPLQSGSSRVLKAMRRTYTRERYLALAEKMRAAIPDLAIGTDIIVGFPGETEDDFRETSRWWRRCATTARSPSSTRRAPAPRPRHARPGAARGQDRAHGAPRRDDPADGTRAEQRTRRPGRGGAGRRPVAYRSDAPPGPHAAEHDGQLRGRRTCRRARRRR